MQYDKFLVAMVQMKSEYGAVPENVDKAIDFIEKAVLKGAKVVCLPETFNTGYNLDVLGPHLERLAEGVDGYTISALSKKAKQYGIYIIAPIVLKGDGRLPYNAAVLIDDEGNVQGVYHKNHLFGDEKNYFAAGSGYGVFDTRYGKIGLLLCYDANFTETFRVEALMGAQTVFLCAAWRVQEKFIWDRLPSVRSIDNGVFSVFVNAYHQTAGLDLFGGSMAANPYGKIISGYTVNAEDLLFANIDLNLVTKYRESTKVIENRRPKTYKMICQICEDVK